MAEGDVTTPPYQDTGGGGSSTGGPADTGQNICPPGSYYDPLSDSCILIGHAPPVLVGAPPVATPLPLPGRAPAPPGGTAKPPGTLSPPSTGGSTSEPSRPPAGIGPTFSSPIFGSTASGSTFTGTSGGSVTGGSTFGITAAPVFVDVNQSVALADNSASSAIGAVASAVQNAIAGSVYTASQVAAGQTNAITSALSSITSGITQGINEAFGNIGDVISGVEGGLQATLGDLGSAIGNQIFASVNPAVILLEQIGSQISTQIGGLAGAVASAVARILPAIIAAATGSVAPVTAALASIQDVLQTQLGGLVTQSTQVADSLGHIGVTLDTVLGHYEQWNQQFTEKITGYDGDAQLHKDLGPLGLAMAGLLQTFVGHASVKLSDRLTTTCAGADLDRLLNEKSDLLLPETGFWSGYRIIIEQMIIWIAKIIPAIGKVNEVVTQDLDRDCPTGLLTPSSLVDAVLRGFLNYSDAVIEAAKGDLSESRFTLLKDLATHQLAPGELVESLYRQIITQPDYQSALAAQGWTAGQIATLTALAVSLVPVEQLWILRRRNLIDDPTLKASLSALRYDAAQQDALGKLAFRPPSMGEAIEGGTAEDALRALNLPRAVDPNLIPEYVQAAAQAEGLDSEATRQRWNAHWNIGPLGSYISLYFRGLITLDQLTAAASRQFLPTEIVPVITEAARPLVQYRTIANMLRIGQIDVQRAGKLLLQHGYTAENAQLLIAYAQRPGPSASATRAAALHAVSIGIAKREWVDGSITESDYYQILLEHGYTIEGANAEITVEAAQQAMLARKENAQLVVDEYGAGLIDEKTALAQLATLGLTVYELAKYAHKLRVFRVKNGKIPSETDLNHFLQADIITSDQYRSQLSAQGYSDQATGWYLAYRQKPPTPPASGQGSATITTGGTTSGSTGGALTS